MLEIIEQLHTDNRDRLEQYLRGNVFPTQVETLSIMISLNSTQMPTFTQPLTRYYHAVTTSMTEL